MSGSPLGFLLSASLVLIFVFIVFIIFRPFDLGHFHWRRFIGGCDFVSRIIQTSFYLFENHFKFKTISCENQLEKKKNNALNRGMK